MDDTRREEGPQGGPADPDAATIQVLVLDSAYREAGLYRRGETLISPLLPGLEIALAEIF